MSKPTKITTVVSSMQGADILRPVMAACRAHGVPLDLVRVGTITTTPGGEQPALFIVQEFQHIAELIERDIWADLIPVFHLQGGPDKGRWFTYVTDFIGGPYYGDKSKASPLAHIKFNGNTLYV